MGLETAEARLIAALRRSPGDPALAFRVAGGRAARIHARALGASWVPARQGRALPWAWRSVDLVHLAGLDVQPPKRKPFALTVHDLAALRFPDEGTLAPWVPRALLDAAAVIAVSHFTARELSSLMDVPPSKIWVVHNGPGQEIGREVTAFGDDELARRGLSRPLFVRLGGYTQRKNVSVLLDAWPEVRRRTGGTLALIGPPQRVRDRLLSDAPLRDGIVVFDYLDSPTVARFIRTADVLVSTSVYEGFGLPPLEAMRATTPVVAVESQAAREVCGDAALYAENDTEALAAAIEQVVRDDLLRRSMQEKGAARAPLFTWERAAQKLTDAYTAIAKG